MAKTKVLVNKEVAASFQNEPEYVKDRFIYLLGTFETRFPRLAEWFHRDKVNDGSPDAENASFRRNLNNDMVCSYHKIVGDDGSLTYFIYMVTYKTIKHAIPADLLRDRPVGVGAFYRLGDIPPGSLFETMDGIKAVKSEYYYGNDAASQCQCVLLASGEYAHFKDKNDEKVRLLSPREFS